MLFHVSYNVNTAHNELFASNVKELFPSVLQPRLWVGGGCPNGVRYGTIMYNAWWKPPPSQRRQLGANVPGTKFKHADININLKEIRTKDRQQQQHKRTQNGERRCFQGGLRALSKHIIINFSFIWSKFVCV